MGQPSFTQITHRFRADDNNEILATWLEPQGDDRTQPVDVKFRIRFLCENIGNKVWSADAFPLYYNYEGGGYLAVTDSTPMRSDVVL